MGFCGFFGIILGYLRPYRLVWSRTPGSHPGNPGSNPGRVTKKSVYIVENLFGELYLGL